MCHHTITALLIVATSHLVGCDANVTQSPPTTTPSTGPIASDEQQIRDAVWRALDALSSGAERGKEIILLSGQRDEELLEAMLKSMRAAERLRVAVATATNSRAQSDAEAAESRDEIRQSVAKAKVTIDGDVATLAFEQSLEEGEVPQEVKAHARRVGGEWKVDALRFANMRSTSDVAETLKYMRLHAKAQDAVAEQFRQGKLKNAAALDYLLRIEMIRLEAEGSVERQPVSSRPATHSATRESKAAEPVRPKPAADASTPLAPGEVRRMIVGGRVAAVAYSPDGRMIASGARLAERPLLLWDAQTGKLVREFVMPPRLDLQVHDVKWTPDGKHVLTCGRTFDRAEAREMIAAGRGSRLAEWLEPVDFDVRVWDVETGRQVREISGHTDTVFQMALSPDGAKLATASADGTVRLWELSSGKEVLKVDAVPKGDFAYGIDFFPSGTELVSAGSDNTVRIYDTTGAELRRWPVERSTFEVAISHDGHRVACARLMAIQIFDAASGKPEGGVAFPSDAGFFSNINAVLWTADGARLIAADGMEEDPQRPAPVGFAHEHNQSIRIWDAGTGRVLAKFRGHVNAVLDLALAPDGNTLASASADGSIRLWKMPGKMPD